MILKNALVLTEAFRFEKLDISVESGIITAMAPRLDGDGRDCTGLRLVPGLVDIHTHGVMGMDAMDETYNCEKAAAFYRKNGITTFLPTTISAEHEKILAVLQRLSQCDAVTGIHLEGPFLSPHAAGAHKKSAIRKGDLQELQDYLAAAKGKLRLATVAPEGNEKFIAQAASLLKISIGHTACDYDTAEKAFELGASHLTHTFNAMPSIHHRAPAPVTAALLRENVTCEVICDGVHVHPAVVRLLYKILGADRMVLISDSMAATGLADGDYLLGGNVKTTVKDGVARTEDGTIAGSTTHLWQGVRNAVTFGIPMEQALKMASLTPARAVKLDKHIGSIAVGKQADLVLCDETLQILNVCKNGQWQN